MQSGGCARLEVVIGTPQKGPYHLALRHANPGTLFSGKDEVTKINQMCTCTKSAHSGTKLAAVML